uniref:Uncharacterized protein n=1 Tax=Gadus morhua TaxID=8049 RepID=A0A8C5FFT4_GADMO
MISRKCEQVNRKRCPKCLALCTATPDCQQGIRRNDTTVGIFVVKNYATSGPEDVGIVLEGLQIMQGLDNTALAAAILFGLMYVLNLNYPPELKNMFEVRQKVVMELDGTTLSKKAQVLKNRLSELLS